MLGRMTGRTLSAETGKLKRYKRYRIFVRDSAVNADSDAVGVLIPDMSFRDAHDRDVVAHDRRTLQTTKQRILIAAAVPSVI
jgi:hypothetical protein